MQNKNQKYGDNNNGGDKPSPFLVDLKKLAEIKAASGTNGKKSRGRFNIEILAELMEKLNQLAFYSLLKLIVIVLRRIFRLSVKICRGVGYAAVAICVLPHSAAKKIFQFFASAVAKIKLFFYRYGKEAHAAIILLYPVVKIFFCRHAHIYIKDADDGHIHEELGKTFCEVKGKMEKKIKETGRRIMNQADEKLKTAAYEKRSAVLKIFALKPALSFAAVLLFLILPFKAFTYYQSISDLKGKVLGASEAAVGELFNAGRSASELDFSRANESFSSAGNNFLRAQEELAGVNGLLLDLAALAPNSDLKLAAGAENVLAAGRAAADLGGNLSLAADSIFKLRGNNGENRNINDILTDFYQFCGEALLNARLLNSHIASIKAENLPMEYREQFAAAREKSIFIENSLSEITDLTDKLRIFLGGTENKRYLLVFQNNAELRASGGFIGSFAVVDFKDGKITNLQAPAGGSYDTEGGMRVLVKAPEPLRLVNPLWHFWDANWWPDWPTSARKLMWFYEKSNGPTVDGVISLTPTVIEKILAIIGPIDMSAEECSDSCCKRPACDSEYSEQEVAPSEDSRGRDARSNGNFNSDVADSCCRCPACNLGSEVALSPEIGRGRDARFNSDDLKQASSACEEAAANNYGVISADNFWQVTQRFAEQKPDVAAKPKKIIGDLMEKIIGVLPERLDKDKLIGLIGALETNLNEKQILFYFTSEDLQNKVAGFGWDGRIKNTNWNYLSVVNTNIAGGKSDRKIKETIEHEAEISADGTIINSLKITRVHTGVKGEEFSGVRNVDWMRIYVPQGSELLSAQGFNRPDSGYFEQPDSGWADDPDVSLAESGATTDGQSGTKIYGEFGKTVFANWSMVDPGKTTIVYLQYKLPFKLAARAKENAGLIKNFYSKTADYLNPAQKQLLPYALLMQKQPGAMPSRIISRLKIADNFKAVWSYPEGLPGSPNGWEISGDLDADKYWATLIEIR